MIASQDSLLRVVMAHRAEANPLVRHYDLRKVSIPGENRGFTLYESTTMQLIISGIGRNAALATVEHLAQLQAPAAQSAAWLNIGIAGHASADLGTTMLAHKIWNVNTGQVWYPFAPFAKPCKTESLQTVDEPQDHYQQGTLYDMEAAGFYEAANRFASTEMVHVLKVVSDNAQQDWSRVTPLLASRLIEDALPQIDEMVRTLSNLASKKRALHCAPTDFKRFTERWHFSVTQRRQLTAILRRWDLVGGPQSAFQHATTFESHGRTQKGSGILQHLRSELSTRFPAWDRSVDDRVHHTG